MVWLHPLGELRGRRCPHRRSSGIWPPGWPGPQGEHRATRRKWC